MVFSQHIISTKHKFFRPASKYPAGEGVKMATDQFEHATFYLTRKQVNEIKELAKQNQISRSALVRMIIREYLGKQDGDRDKKQ